MLLSTAKSGTTRKGDRVVGYSEGRLRCDTHGAFTNNGPAGFGPAAFDFQAGTLRRNHLSMLYAKLRWCSNRYSNFRPVWGRGYERIPYKVTVFVVLNTKIPTGARQRDRRCALKSTFTRRKLGLWRA